MNKQQMYTVIYNRDFGCPGELQRWLNEQYADGLELVAIDNGYYVFKQREKQEGEK